jgi:lambda family phage portal protein
LLNPFKKLFTRKPKPTGQTFLAGSGISANYYQTGNNSYGNGSKYESGMSSSRLVVLHNHQALRQSARDMMYDSPECRALVTSAVDNIVDVGMKLKPVPVPEILKLSPEFLEQWSEDVALRFHMWANSKKSDRSRTNTYYQNQRLYQLFKQRDGDIFVRLYYNREKDLFNPLQIEFIDPNQIRGAEFTSTYMQTGIDDGITRDSSGREIGYKIWNYNSQTGAYSETTIPAVGEKSGRIFMLHGYNPEYAGQGRGYSPLSHILQEFEKITDFRISTIQKAINQASFIGAIENEEKDPSNPLAGRVAGPIREYGSYPTPASDAQNVTDASTTPIINWDAMPEATITQPGSVLIGNLRRGDKIKYLQDTSPSQNFDTFIGSFFASIAASTGWSIETVLKKFNANYSASRATLILCWRVANIQRLEQNSDFDNPIYEMWLSEEIAAGRIQAPGFSDPLLREAWLNCEWAGIPMPSIDPLKNMQAAKLAVELGAETLDDVARENNGSSGKANRAKLARQFEELPEPSWGWVPGKQINNNMPEDGDSDNE